MGFHVSIKRPLGGKNSIVNRTASHPLPALVGVATGGLGLDPTGLGGAALGAGIGDMNQNFASKKRELARQAGAPDSGQDNLDALAAQEEAKRQALAKEQQGQINDFANQQEGSVADFRKILAQHLSDTAQQTFQQANPGILEDLNSRGLFTSQTARDDSQNRALQQLATQQQSALSNFDTNEFNNIQDIKGSGLSALLGGNQSALDSALELRKAGIQRSFDVADQQRNQAFQQMLANQQNRQQMISSILGLGGTLGAGLLGGL